MVSNGGKQEHDDDRSDREGQTVRPVEPNFRHIKQQEWIHSHNHAQQGRFGEKKLVETSEFLTKIHFFGPNRGILYFFDFLAKMRKRANMVQRHCFGCSMLFFAKTFK